MKTKQIYSLRQDLKQGYGSEIIEENRGDPQSFCILSRPLMKPIFIMIKKSNQRQMSFWGPPSIRKKPPGLFIPINAQCGRFSRSACKVIMENVVLRRQKCMGKNGSHLDYMLWSKNEKTDR